MRETLKYRRRDILARSEVIRKFADTVHDTFKVKRTDVRTVPALAMRVYRSKYRQEGVEIPYRTGKVDQDIRNGYYGGIVAAIKPEVENGYYYDVNSAYPAAMMKPMPVGMPTLRAIDVLDDTVFGSVHATVTSPDTTVNNVLPRPMRDEDGVPVFKHGFKSTG